MDTFRKWWNKPKVSRFFLVVVLKREIKVHHGDRKRCDGAVSQRTYITERNKDIQQQLGRHECVCSSRQNKIALAHDFPYIVRICDDPHL